MKSKKPIIITLVTIISVIVLVLSFFLIRGTVANITIQQIANEKGEKYGVSDFKSKSTNFWGEVWAIDLRSNNFASLSDEDRFQLILSISTDEKLLSLLVEDTRNRPNPLVDHYFQIYSGEGWHYFQINDNTNTIKLQGGEETYYVENAESYGYELLFSNEFGTEDTTCIANGCDNKIVRTGDSNACIEHAGICSDCHIYIDKNDDRCDRCAKEAFNAVYDDVKDVLGDPW